MSLITTPFQCGIGSPSECSKTRRGNKGILIGKKKKRMSLFAGDMIISVENSKESTKNSWN